MAFDTTTTITWASEADQINADLSTARKTALATMISEGKTDGSSLAITPVITIRYWRDLAAAQEFGTFISNAAVAYNCTIISIEYGTRSQLLVQQEVSFYIHIILGSSYRDQY